MKRISRLRKEMERRGFDAYMSTKSVRYLSGTSAGKAVIVPIEGEPLLVCSRLELGMAEKESRIKNIVAFSPWKSPLMPGEKIRFCEPWEVVAEYLGDSGAKAVGFDDIGSATLRRLRSVHPASYRNAPELIWEVRKIKFPEELALMRRSAKIASRGMKCAEECISPGRSELEIAGECEREMRLAGSEGTSFGTIVASGPNSWMPHATAGERKLRKGDLVVVDLGAVYKGYASDMTRTFSLNAGRNAERLLETVKMAHGAGLSMAHDGTRARDVDAKIRMLISRAGYSQNCLHGSGHGVGMDVHEPPSLSPVSKDVLKRGMVITVEPGIYVPKIGGARWEDMVEIRKTGCVLLTS